jgi:hypothetical protein
MIPLARSLANSGAAVAATLACLLVTPTEAQVSRPGATHLDTREVVVSVFPDSLDGVHFDARIRHKKKWVFFSARFNPRSVSSWLESVDRLGLSEATPAVQGQPQSPVLAGLGGNEGIVLVAPKKQERDWVLQRLDDEPLLIRADRRFNDTLLVALRAAIPFSGLDSAAFASGLVAATVTEPQSCSVRIIHQPAPHYPIRMAAEQIQGRVTVRYIVGADGRPEPSSIEWLWASHAEFIRPSVEAFAQSEFRPAVLNGHPIRRRVYQSVSFRQEGSPAVWQ